MEIFSKLRGYTDGLLSVVYYSSGYRLRSSCGALFPAAAVVLAYIAIASFGTV